MKPIHTLVIVFNEFYPDTPRRYLEILTHEDGSETRRYLEDEEIGKDGLPLASDYDEVFENGSGSHDSFTAFKAKPVRQAK